MSVHRVYLPDLGHGDFEPGAVLEITGQEARHAVRVKRLMPGDVLEILNGQGLRAVAVLGESRKHPAGHGKTEWAVDVRIESVAQEPPISPRLHVLACAPKLTRVEDMVDQLSQVGAAAWFPLVTRHTLTPPKAERVDKLERVAAEAAKQCGRAWTMEIGSPVPLADALSRTHRAIRPSARLVIADPRGAPYSPDGSTDLALLIGPEAGFTDDEVDAACRAGAMLCSIGPHLMRVGTAAVVASGLILNAEQPR
ncbi:MAG: RsmE family RNA methyltransferase [Planctomycetota bacterium]|nr:RsmE family RNA methyltransferase [Planctomycetota bacterium]